MIYITQLYHVLRVEAHDRLFNSDSKSRPGWTARNLSQVTSAGFEPWRVMGAGLVPLALICLLKMVNLTVLLHKEFEIPTLRSKFFEILNFVFLSEVANKSFWVKFSGLLKSSKNHIKVREYSTNRLIFSHFLKPKKFVLLQCSLPNYFASKTQKLSLRYYFS